MPVPYSRAWLRSASSSEIRAALDRGDLGPLPRGKLDHLGK